MYSIFKYNFILNLEKKFKNSFKLSTKNEIIVLPPIIKFVKLEKCLCFFVVDKNEENLIKRPIGLICVNKNGKTKIYDFSEYDFCYKNDFNKIYYDLAEANFWPNKSKFNEEYLRLHLQELNEIYNKVSIFQNLTTNLLYQSYFKKIEKMFPADFFEFYNLLQENKIFKINEKLKEDRNNFLKKFKEEQNKLELENINLIKKNKEIFYIDLFRKISAFIKQEVISSFTGKGAYSKILFYQELGNELKNLSQLDLENCYDPKLNKKIVEKNKEDFLNIFKVKIIKIYSKSIQNKFSTNNNVDTLSRILIVFLNCLLIEEIKKTYNKNFEEEISECKQIFNENIENLKIYEAKQNLQNLYNDLCEDYLQSSSEKFSDLFFCYLKIYAEN